MRGNKLTTALLLPLFLLLLATELTLCAPVELQQADIEKWAIQLETDFASLRQNLLANQIETQFAANGVNATVFDETAADALLVKIRDRIQTLIGNSEAHVQRIRVSAEQAYLNYTTRNFTCSAMSSFPYIRAAAIVENTNLSADVTRVDPTNDFCLSQASLPLSADARLYDMLTNRQMCSVHVPPNIYDASNSILNVAQWTSAIDKQFMSNANSDPTLKWQFFGSTHGFLKIYPAVQWHLQTSEYTTASDIDFFDLRSQYWYLLAASYPKDMVILVDSSGSMKGQRALIANQTLLELTETLTPNDYFNIIFFMNNQIKYLSSAHNRTLVQATDVNIYAALETVSQDQRKPETSRTFPPFGMSDHSQALTEAFTLLKLAKENAGVPSSKGLQTIVLITDGAPSTFAPLFSTYNPTKQIRVLAYLIGQEASDWTVVREIACNNRGFFAQITTMADAKENVLQSVPVFATTNAMQNDHFFAWTSVHANQVETKGMSMEARIQLFTTVSQAAYDLKELNSTTRQSASLLGVAAVDVPIDDFERLGPSWELGALGYIFIANNNGHLLLHPDLRTYDSGGNSLEFFDNRDVVEVEYPAPNITGYSPPNYNLQLRINIINDVKAAIDMTRVMAWNDFTHAARQPYKYLTTPLNSSLTGRRSPLTLCLALPWSAASPSVRRPARLTYWKSQTVASVSAAEISSTFSPLAANANCTSYPSLSLGVTIGSYRFCQFTPEILQDFRRSPVCALAKVLAMNASSQAALSCSTEFLSRILTDASVANVTGWSEFSATVKAKFGVARLFLWTESGLVKWMGVGQSAEADFVTRHRNVSREPLYQRTASLNLATPPSSTPISLVTPPSAASVSANAAAGVNSSLYYTTPLRAAGDSLALVGVAGAELSLSSVSELFAAATNSCAVGDACTRCSLSDLRCYLIDSSGLVVASETAAEVGSNFGGVECTATRTLLNAGVFVELPLYDYQTTCIDSKPINSAGSALLDPIRFLLRLVTWAVMEAALLLQDMWIQILLPGGISGPSPANAVTTANATSYTTNYITNCYAYTLLAVNSNLLGKARLSTRLNVTCDSVNSTGACLTHVYFRPLPGTNLAFAAVSSESSCHCTGCQNPYKRTQRSSPSSIEDNLRQKPEWFSGNVVVNDNATQCSSSAVRTAAPSWTSILHLTLSVALLVTARS